MPIPTAMPRTSKETHLAKAAAIFDLDGTVIDCSSERRFFLYLAKQGIIGWADFVRWGSTALWRLPTGPKAALKANRTYLKGFPADELPDAGRACFTAELEAHVASRALDRVAEHEARGDVIVLLSGSLTALAEPFRDVVKAVDVVASELAVAAGRLTGAISNLQPVAEGKVTHAKSLAASHDFDLFESAAYADSGSDIPLLEQVREPFAVNPDGKLRRHARARGWEILDWHGTR